MMQRCCASARSSHTGHANVHLAKAQTPGAMSQPSRWWLQAADGCNSKIPTAPGSRSSISAWKNTNGMTPGVRVENLIWISSWICMRFLSCTSQCVSKCHCASIPSGTAGSRQSLHRETREKYYWLYSVYLLGTGPEESKWCKSPWHLFWDMFQHLQRGAVRCCSSTLPFVHPPAS